MNDRDSTLKTRELVIPGLIEPAAIELRERTMRAPTAHEVVIAMEATGVSYAEIAMLRGRYPGQPAFPFVPGYDVVGRVHAIGSAVDPRWRGKRVATMTGFGAWAELVVAHEQSLVEVPEALDAAEVDALIVNGLTAYKMLHRVARVRRGETIVVHGAGGGVGTLLVQLARRAEVRVIGTCRAAQRASVEALGAEVVDYTAGHVLEEVRALAPDGVHAVFDHVGGDSVRASDAMLRPGGIVVSYGNASAIKEKTAMWAIFGAFLLRKLRYALRPGGRRLTFFDVWGRGTLGADHSFRPARFWRELREDLGHLVALLADGALKPLVAERVDWRDAGAAMTRHRAGGFVGKIVLVGSGS